jgi:nucleoid DNA-binding protein
MKRHVKVHGYTKRRGHHVRAHTRTIVTKTDLIKKISEKHKEMKHKDIADVLNTATDEIGSSLKAGHDVRINGLGSFRVKVKPARPARKGRNPFDGKEMMFKASPEKKVIKFKATKELKL